MLAGGAVATAVAQAAGLAALGLASIVLGRALGPDGFGTFAVALSLQAFVVGVASLGLANGIAYEVATGRWPPGSALRHAVVASILLGVLGAAGGAAVLAVFGDSLLPGVSTGAVAVLMVGVPLGVAVLVLVGVAISLERYEAAALMLAGQPIAIAVLASAAAIAFELSATIAAIGIALAASGVASAIWALGLASKLDSESDAPPAPARLREAIRFGAQTWASDLLNLINLRADLILVGALAGSGEAGLYAVAATIASLGVIAPQALAQVLLPRIGALDQAPSETGEDAVATIGRAGRQSVLVAGATSVVLVAVILLVPTFYGSDFDGSVELGLILVPGIAAFGISRVLAYMLAGLGAPGVVLRLSVAVVVPSLVVFVLVIPSEGATGAAIISTISYAATLLAMLVAICRRADLAPASLLVPRREDLSAYSEALAAIPQYVRSRRS